jgi:hypothetical protein
MAKKVKPSPSRQGKLPVPEHRKTGLTTNVMCGWCGRQTRSPRRCLRCYRRLCKRVGCHEALCVGCQDERDEEDSALEGYPNDY